MAVYLQQDSSQHFEDSAENFRTNNPGQTRFVREDDRKIFVGGLEKETTQEDLGEHFGQFGPIQYIAVKVDATTGWCRGYAFIVYQTLESLEKVFEHTNHEINGKIIEPKKAIPRKIKLFIGGLSPDLTPGDITRYFRRFAFIVNVEMPYDKVTKQRRGFCFLTFDNMRAVHEILGSSRHVIKGTQVEVKVSSLSKWGHGIMRGDSIYMAGTQRNVMGQGGFLPQSGYPPHDPGYCNRGHAPYIPCPGYSSNYSYGYPSYGYPSYGHPTYYYPNYGYPSYGYPSYGYPSYVSGAGANCQSEGYEASGCQLK
ncbi:RNA-binding protein squid-like [Myzus persicae]|uniref:RNA-binding protein squid-like n=1 Tax=Myzus persicae TaxID=13164 RepID=UPI000B9304D6|nr:RNA-binding protein squid-like [Myzus persicae]